jgi:hypothetical protein
MQRIGLLLALALAVASPARAAPEASLSADLDGDGKSDRVTVTARDDDRTLQVVLANGRKAGSLAVAPAPLGPADLAIAKNVLVVTDLTGGTSATQATYRYRYDPKQGKMRLIGLDATDYSRTFQTDMFEISWNLLTGDFTASYSKLKPEDEGGDEAYEDPVVTKRKRPSPPLYMETTPDPEEIIQGETWPTGE